MLATTMQDQRQLRNLAEAAFADLCRPGRGTRRYTPTETFSIDLNGPGGSSQTVHISPETKIWFLSTGRRTPGSSGLDQTRLMITDETQCIQLELRVPRTQGAVTGLDITVRASRTLGVNTTDGYPRNKKGPLME